MYSPQETQCTNLDNIQKIRMVNNSHMLCQAGDRLKVYLEDDLCARFSKIRMRRVENNSERNIMSSEMAYV